ncbi:MAG: hypothetical protein NTZ69_03785 [Bacteroidia bacterium]|nr:hypothetical protein [Bacteroidia bacterium]
MRKILSILFASLILISGLHISIAKHYCSGESAAFEKISVTGELATCGMEDPKDEKPLQGVNFKAHCCDNEVSTFVVDNNYAPSFSIFKVFPQPVLQVCRNIEVFNLQQIVVLSLYNTNVLPPGNYLASAVSLPDICVFRI